MGTFNFFVCWHLWYKLRIKLIFHYPQILGNSKPLNEYFGTAFVFCHKIIGRRKCGNSPTPNNIYLFNFFYWKSTIGKQQQLLRWIMAHIVSKMLYIKFYIWCTQLTYHVLRWPLPLLHHQRAIPLPLALTEEWLGSIMSNQSMEGCCKRINTLVKLPKFQFRQFRHNHTDS